MRLEPTSFSDLHVFLLALCVNIGGVLTGMHISVLSGLLETKPFEHFPQLAKTLLSAELMIAFTLSCPIAGWLASRFGRRPSLILTAGLYLASSVVPLPFAPSIAPIAVARAIAGVAYGFANTVCPIYTAEIASPRLRGALASFFQLGLVLGILFSQIANLVFANGPWRATIGVAAAPALIMLISVLLWVPESPAWRNPRIVSNSEDRPNNSVSNNSFWNGLRQEASLRLRLLIGVWLSAAKQLSGITAVLLYAPNIVSDATGWKESMDADKMRIASLRVTAVIGAVQVGATILTVLLADRVGRKPLLICGGIVMSAALCVLAAFRNEWLASSVVPTFAAIFSYVIGFSVSYGAMQFVLLAEIFQPQYKATGTAICTAVLGVGASAVGLSFRALLDEIGGWVYMIFAISMFVSSLFVWIVVPETKGLSFEEVDELLDR